MEYKIFYKKPPNTQLDKQLFSFDVSHFGAKNFLFSTYKNMYLNIKSQTDTPSFYEDNTHTSAIKLFIDFDEKITFTNKLERDKYAQMIIQNITTQIQQKLKIDNPSVIILISDTLLKMSLHFVYPDIIFNNIYEMGYFMNDINLVDHNVYKTGCFRMIFCSKLGKQNKLIYYTSFNYTKPTDEYQLFLDACICYTDNKSLFNFIIDTNTNTNTNTNTDIKNKSKHKQSTQIIQNNNTRNYIYKNVNFDVIQSALEKLSEHSNDYNKWLVITFCLKDIFLSVQTKQEKNIIYHLFDTFSKQSTNYNKSANKRIFLSLEPKIDINYLFKLSETQYYLLPFYNYQDIIFNPQKHTNIIHKTETYIDIDTNLLLKYKYMFIKSPTGTGKTTFLKQIIQKIDIENIISITSRVNLAGEHMKELDLSFYLDLQDFENCNRLVIQLESLQKCNYTLFKNSIIILDEVNSLLSHLRSPTMDKKRKAVYLYLIELIKNAKYVISMDADLSDWNISFMQDITFNDYIIYYNTIKNKIGVPVVIYKSPQVMIDIMQEQIQNNKYFIACFDTLKQMNQIITYLSTFGKKEEWLIYSSEIDYKLIDTKTWINKFVFFTPSIIYGIDYNYQQVDVFSFTYKNHLNPLQIYQMISRGRKQNKVHIYCNGRFNYLKYKSVQDVINETELYEKNLGMLLPLSSNYIDIDDKAYRTMYYNYKYMDSVLKTNIKEYLIDILINKGYDIEYNDEIKETQLEPVIVQKNVREKIVEMLQLDKDNLSELEQNISSDDKLLEKHFNLRILLNNNIDDKLVESVSQNLFIESIKNKYTKIKICKELMNLLEIGNLESLNKELVKHFNKNIDSQWLKENISTIKKTFDIRTKKYDTDTTYYNIYILLTTILKNLFDNDLFIRKDFQIKKEKFVFYYLADKKLQEHLDLIKRFNNDWKKVEFL